MHFGLPAGPDLTRSVTMALFAGFFAAMALVGAIVSAVVRSRPSAWYAAFSASLAAILVYRNPAWSVPGPTGALTGTSPHAASFAAMLVLMTAFAFSLLGAWARDRRFAIVSIALLALDVGLLFCEGGYGAAWRYYAFDRVAIDALLLSLAWLGVRAIGRGDRAYALPYTIAFAGLLAVLALGDLATRGAGWLEWSFEGGMAWGVAFFAYSVAIRNRGILAERDRLDRMAQIDALTGVANRRAFDERLALSWNAALRTRAPLAIAMIDIDRFKELNDRSGHQAGDACLGSVARLCAAELQRGNDSFARYGGEEFAAILSSSREEGALGVAERMRAAVENEGTVTISIGVAAALPDESLEPDELVARAERALYEAKAGGRNCIRAARSA